jgi:hypothetical protein
MFLGILVITVEMGCDRKQLSAMLVPCKDVVWARVMRSCSRLVRFTVASWN